jgi:hypothetical protein
MLLRKRENIASVKKLVFIDAVLSARKEINS